MTSNARMVEVVLPAGLETGKNIVTNAYIVPMSGETRESIARLDVRKDQTRIADAVLMSCVHSIGDIKPTPQILRRLILGDREFLMTKIRSMSKKGLVTYSMACGACEEAFHGTIDLNTIPIDPMPKDTINLADSSDEGEEVGPVRGFKVSLADWNAGEITFRFPRGEDQAAISKTTKINPITAIYTMLWRCIHTWDGRSQMDIPTSVFRDMTDTDELDYIQGEFRNHQPGPDFGEPVLCPNCGAPNLMSFQSTDFFFDLTARQRKPSESPG